MLVLTRRVGEEILIDNQIRVTVLSSHGGRIRLGIEAPAHMRIHRTEVLARRMGLNARPRAGAPGANGPSGPPH
jgi:carbon storage regulator